RVADVHHDRPVVAGGLVRRRGRGGRGGPAGGGQGRAGGRAHRGGGQAGRARGRRPLEQGAAGQPASRGSLVGGALRILTGHDDPFGGWIGARHPRRGHAGQRLLNVIRWDKEITFREH